MANIVEKWNFCLQKYKDGNPEDPAEAPAVDSKCVCFERDNVEGDPKMGIEGGTVSLFVILRTNLPKRNLRCAKKKVRKKNILENIFNLENKIKNCTSKNRP